MHPALSVMLTDVLTRYPYTGQDAYGKPIYGPPQTHPGRLEFHIRRHEEPIATERSSNARLFLDGTVPLDLRDKLVLTDGTTPPILSAYRLRDVDGTLAHWQILF